MRVQCGIWISPQAMTSIPIKSNTNPSYPTQQTKRKRKKKIDIKTHQIRQPMNLNTTKVREKWSTKAMRDMRP